VSASTRWSVQIQPGYPSAVLLGGFALAVTAAASVGASAWMQGAGNGMSLAAAATTLALIGGFWWRSRRDGGAAALRLAAGANGLWSLQENGRWRAVSLARVWRGPCWVTLALSPADAPGQTVVVTLWRGAVAAPDWRKLCVLLRARPGGKQERRA